MTQLLRFDVYAYQTEFTRTYVRLMLVLFDNLKCNSARSFPRALQWRRNGYDGVSNHQPHDFYSIVYKGANQRKHQSSPSLAFVWGIHRWMVNSPHKWPVTQKMFSFDDVFMANKYAFPIPDAPHYRAGYSPTKCNLLTCLSSNISTRLYSFVK